MGNGLATGLTSIGTLSVNSLLQAYSRICLGEVAMRLGCMLPDKVDVCTDLRPWPCIMAAAPLIIGSLPFMQ